MTLSIDGRGTVGVLGSQCQNCGKRAGTERWVGDGGVLALTHGHYAMWCNVCVLEAQIAYAKKAIERLPALERTLAIELSAHPQFDIYHEEGLCAWCDAGRYAPTLDGAVS